MSTANKIALVSNRVERAKAFLLSQFRDKPNINALVDALVSELQELENVVTSLQTVRTLDGAYGWWLDRIGDELDISRGNYNDNDYKTAIKIAMAKQSASASVDDILRIVALITSDTEAVIHNDSHYLMELWSYLFCVSDSYDGLDSLAKLFPLNTRVRLVQHEPTPFKFGTANQGFGNGTLNNLIYVNNGIVSDARFVSIPTQDIPPPITNAPTTKTTPYIYGEGLVGSTLTLVAGEYDGDDPLTITYQWMLDGNDIPSATNITYVVDTGDAGKNINCKVLVSNSYGSLVAYTNYISVSVDVPPAATIENDLGMSDIFAVKSTPYDDTPDTSVATLIIKSDGTTQALDNGVSAYTNAWASTPSAGIGSGYKVQYSVLSGAELVGLNQNAAYTLSSNLSLTQSVSSKNNAVKTGRYRFTIFEIADPTNSYSVDITITAQLERDV